MAETQQIKLPVRVSRRLQGKKIRIEETADGILLKPVEDLIEQSMGMLKGAGVSVAKFMALKARDKEMER